MVKQINVNETKKVRRWLHTQNSSLHQVFKFGFTILGLEIVEQICLNCGNQLDLADKNTTRRLMRIEQCSDISVRRWTKTDSTSKRMTM